MKFVWKDDATYYTGSTPGFVVWDNLASQEIYSGTFAVANGVKEPFYLNRFAQTIMEGGTLDFTTGITQHPTMWKDLSIIENKTGPRAELNRGKYVYAFAGDETPYLSNPVNGKLDPRMYFFYTYAFESLPAGTTNINIEIEGI